MMKGLEVLAGAMLLANMYTPLALLILSPIVVNILMFHLFLAGNPGMAILITILMLIQGKAHWFLFKNVVCHKCGKGQSPGHTA
jgi:hypothetical protein